MFESIKAFTESWMGANPRRTFDASDYRFAAVALLMHVAEADGRVVAAERERIRILIAQRFDLDPTSVAAIMQQAEARERNFADITDLTDVLKRVLDTNGRRKIVEMLWEVARADGSVHEFEDDYIWRVAELLGVPQTDIPDATRSAATPANSR